jgi:hypothetical protein
MLQPEIYPEELPRIQKQLILRQQADAIGLSKHFTAVRQTVAFREKTNAAGVHLNASKLTGQDSVGLNDGGKNTVLTTYLADAFNFGAEMYAINLVLVRASTDENTAIAAARCATSGSTQAADTLSSSEITHRSCLSGRSKRSCAGSMLSVSSFLELAQLVQQR